MKKAPTRAEREHMDRVAALGCIVCRNLSYGYSPAIIHHCYAGRKGWRDNMLILPLCPRHHNQPLTLNVAIHAGTRTWQKTYGTEAELMAQVQTLLVEVA